MLNVLVRNWDRWLTMEIRTLARAKLLPSLDLGNWQAGNSGRVRELLKSANTWCNGYLHPK